MEPYFAKIKCSSYFPVVMTGEKCVGSQGRGGAFGRGKEVRGWPLTGKENVQASQDQADLVMAAPIM